MFYGGRMKSMPAKLKSDDGKNILIRPLFYCREKLIQRWNEYRSFPIIPCNLCGSQDNLQRQAVKQMLAGWDKQFPGRVESIARSLSHISPSHMADLDLFDFKSLQISNERISLTHIDWKIVLVKIPYTELSKEALLGVIDSFILREGTDYGHEEININQKRSRILSMLHGGQAEIVFYQEIDHIDIVLVDYWEI